ncbi:type II secretion system protein GspE [Pseudoalteromonas sp. MSK9-3]|uniref:GspE/PulE family protein n=1 Tax=Pseudoalteromonas sp. MSK9-3 TaxID=1897633 RepID=UPI000E6C84DF|nr:GspE/PulE family protein [Pseudoalteromonas sp. MSK9-3]RJE76905.1 type II secretion system protein GspE [Pseudoalteromonas sp. MSK9-3]
MTLIKLLTEQFDISSTDIEKALSYQQKYSGRLEDILVNMGSLPEEQIPTLLSRYLNIPLLNMDDYTNLSPHENIECESLKLFAEHKWVPLEVNSDRWLIATKDPLNSVMLDWIGKCSVDVELLIATESEIQELNHKLIRQEASDNSSLVTDEENKLRELASEAPVVNLLNSLISRSLRAGASDMHLEPFKGKYRARFRVDGVLHESEVLAASMQLPIVTRLKILAGMDIAEKRRPQDGKIEMRIANQEIDIRVSALPVNEGESIVMRFLKKESVQYDMSILGLSEDVYQCLQLDIKKTAGVVLLTGPTGSGKTTTLYTFLNSLNNEDVKIITLEDPVEYQLDGVNQVQVNSDIGFDFSAGLRSVVRQDPDIIMLGEIRDKETAQIALQSALTGHLVFSTVHTNNAASAYTRLLDLGVDEFLLNAALISVVAQRLARKVCSNCSGPDPEEAALIEKYNLRSIAREFNVDTIKLKKGAGCAICDNTGYKGRLAITEYLACDDHIKAFRKDADFILNAQKHNKALKRRTLMEDGFFKAIVGETTIEEVIRVAG